MLHLLPPISLSATQCWLCLRLLLYGGVHVGVAQTSLTDTLPVTTRVTLKWEGVLPQVGDEKTDSEAAGAVGFWAGHS